MGIGSDAYLIFGVPVLARNEEEPYGPTQFWDEKGGWWREFDGDLKIVGYGHYEDSDNTRGILTSAKFKKYSGDCWDPTGVSAKDLDVESYQPDDYDEFREAAASYSDDAPRWWLVASVG